MNIIWELDELIFKDANLFEITKARQTGLFCFSTRFILGKYMLLTLDEKQHLLDIYGPTVTLGDHP
jgi:hypothetical protein